MIQFFSTSSPQGQASVHAANNDPKKQIILGHHYMFSMVIPEGWETTSDQEQNVQGLLYPEGNSAEKSSVIMFACGSSKGNDDALEIIVDEQVEKIKNDFPEATIADGKASKLRDKKTISKLYDLDGNKCQLVVYVDEPKSFSTLVLSAYTRKELDQTIPDFEQFVGSYEFISNDVERR